MRVDGSGTLRKTRRLKWGVARPVILDRFIDDAIAPDVLHDFHGPVATRMPLRAVVLAGLHVALGLDEGHRGDRPWLTLLPTPRRASRSAR